MVEPQITLADIKRRMQATVDSCSKDLAGLRAGRANIAFLQPVVVEAYGGQLPLAELGSLSAPEPRLLCVHVWDKALLPAVEKALREADLGLNPQLDGQTIRLPIPQLSAERRSELKKLAGRYSEAGRVALRNIRRDGIENFRREEKAGELSEDDVRRLGQDIQGLTDNAVAAIDKLLARKDKDLLEG